ncbi:MAG TPA: PKD domain-containing protein, partial [Chitinophagales bacterium]|nr:PKD domain-containing protein [Chitinophagales bacterium]
PINPTGGQAEIEGGVQNAAGDAFYGGNDPNDNSGVIRYVRIEFGGVAFQTNNEINGLTLGGVGRGTVVDYVQISYTGDDGLECFGGTVDMKHLVLTNNLDDDLDTDFGYTGNIQFALVTRDPNVADAAGASNGFESDNDATGSSATPQTHPVYSNVTVIGPLETPGTMISTYYKRGAHLRRNTATSIYNSLIMGFPTGILSDGGASEGNAAAETLQIQNTVLAGNTQALAVASGSTWDINAWFNTASYNNSILANTADAMLTAPYAAAPNATPAAGSPLLTGASFSNAALTNPFFETVPFRGAFGSEDWTACWTEWDPNNANYTNATNHNPAAAFNMTSDNGTYDFTSTSTNATSYNWNFGVSGAASTDANPTYTYATGGTYTVTLIATNNCGADTTSQQISVVTGIGNLARSIGASLYPNPTKAFATLAFEVTAAQHIRIELTDIVGRVLNTVANGTFAAGSQTLRIDTDRLANGIYTVVVRSENGIVALPLSVAR